MTFDRYLLQIGESACTAERRLELYNEWRKSRLLVNQKKRRKHQKRLELSFSLEQYEAFKKDAEKLNISVTKLIQQVVDKGYHQEVFLMVSHELVHKIHVSLIRIGTNVNTLCFYASSRKYNELYRSDMEKLKKEFYALQNLYLSFCTPVSLENFFRQEQSKNPQFIRHAQMILNDIKKEQDVH